MKLFNRGKDKDKKEKKEKNLKELKDLKKKCMFESWDENYEQYDCALVATSIKCEKGKCPWWHSSTLVERKK